MLKFIMCALLLTAVQANLNGLPKIFKMYARNKEHNYDSSELSEPKPVTKAQNDHNKEIIPKNTQEQYQNSKLPNVVQISKLNNTKQEYEDDIIKRKIFKLAKDAKIDVDRKMATIDKVHDGYKNKRLYKIGYIVSFLNKTYEDLSVAYQYVEDNKKDWDVLRILNSYEKVKNGNDFVSELLNVLQRVLKDRQTLKTPRDPIPNVSNVSNRMAWNYYDDS